MIFWPTFVVLLASASLANGRGTEVALSSPSPSPNALVQAYRYLSQSLTSSVHYIGAIFPLRGVASFFADLGLPGAAGLMRLLTPDKPSERSGKRISRVDSSSSFSSSNYGEELHSLFGALHGEQECLEKLACLSGKHVSALSGATTLTLLLSIASGQMPESLQGPYLALRDAIMYTDHCEQYQCETTP